MKIQCPCGAKYSFDLTPEISQAGARFVCPACGLDSSEAVNELIRRELGLGLSGAATPSPPPPARPPAAMSPPVAAVADPPPDGGPRLRISSARAAETTAPSPATPAARAEAPLTCPRHPGQMTTGRCVVCQKPLCTKCMDLFGYVCSPLCNAKAETLGIQIPEFAGKKSRVEARRSRKVGLIAGVVAAVVVLLLGFWFWYVWIGSAPRPTFSVRFADSAYAGRSAICDQNQIVFLHGGTLARYDLKSKQQIWSRELIDKNQITNNALQAIKDMQSTPRNAGDYVKIPSVDELVREMQAARESALGLHARNQNIWVATPDKLVHYDWDTGKPIQEIEIKPGAGRLSARLGELQLLGFDGSGRDLIVHLNMTNGEPRVEMIGGPQTPAAASVAAQTSNLNAPDTETHDRPTAGLPIGKPGNNPGQALDPAKVAEQAQSLSMPAKIALPATLAANFNQERALAELEDQPTRRPPAQRKPKAEPVEQFSLIPGEQGYVQFSVRLLESKYSTRSAMKAVPGKSALNGDLTTSRTADAANEILNEMQRSRGGDVVTEDESRYLVTVRALDAQATPDWTGKVIGEPSVFALKTVTVVAGGKTLIVLDKKNTRLWDATLSYKVTGGTSSLDGENSMYGRGPCVERDDVLYVFDQAVLTAFDLKSGAVHWRLPSVGIVGLFFDDQGMMYVNTTTSSPDSIKYSRQIDVTQKTGAVALKIEPRTGKILWTVDGAPIVYVAGKFVFTMRSHQAEDNGGEENPFATGLEIPSFVEIKRLKPDNGHVMWVYTQKRAPLDIDFDGNSIRLVFKKEVEVLKIFSF